MKEGDPDTMYAYYCLHKFHWTPSFFVNLPLKEKVVIKVFIDEKVKEEKKQNSKVNSTSSRSSKNVSGRRR